MQGTSSNGIVKGAFYMRNKRGSTLKSLLGRTHSSDMEMFEYLETEDGKIIICEECNKTSG